MVSLVPMSSDMRSKFQVNMDKFKDASGPYMPVANGSWVKALSGFSPTREDLIQHPNFTILRGYPFLDPAIFSGQADPKVVSKFLTLWLFVRSSWLEQALSRDGHYFRPFPKPQEWKNWLLHGIAPKIGLLPPKSASSGKGARGLTMKQMEELFGIRLSLLFKPSCLTWSSRMVMRFAEIEEKGIENVPYDINLVREVVWDLTEHNFRAELVALDHCIHPRHSMTQQMADARNADLCDCFSGDSVINLTWPADNRGCLGARDAADRWPFVEAFRKIVSTWPHPAAGMLLNPAMAITGPDDPRLEKVQDLAFPAYCQLFFRFFGRAPTIPRVRP